MSDLTSIKGLGPKSIEYLGNLNIHNITDLLEYYPYKYNFISLKTLDEIKDTNGFVEGIVESIALLRRFGKMNSLNFRVGINKKIVNVVIFNRAFIRTNIKPGTNVTIFGKYDEKKNSLVASDISFGKFIGNHIESVYHLTSGISMANMRKYMLSALNSGVEVPDYIPDYLNEKYGFITKKTAIKKIHTPIKTDDIKKAKLKLIYEELFLFMFKINYLKKIKKATKKEINRNVDIERVNEFIRTLPFELTADQNKSINDIYEDMTSNKLMNRMLQGDVGSGKTVVAVIASYINHLAGYQTALMAPTEILARQHYENIVSLLDGTGVKVALLVGSLKKSEKESIYNDLINGDVSLVVGTHALISEGVNFKNLGLVITDEQHRFGVNQRANLRNKGNDVDTLYMSATPIPRTFALTLYGDMDISNIKTKPKGRKEIETIIKGKDEIKDVLQIMLDTVKEGHQVFIVSPMIEENEEFNLTNVVKLKEQINTAFNNKIKTEILHGKLNKEDKEKVMKDFQSGKTKILISTTVIEVGVDIKNATLMVIFDAERFGMSTLHQLRGRVGRNSFDSKCILIGDSSNKRLEALAESNDGFYITEKDFELRGEGDLFGVKQSGDMTFKIASLKEDYKILLQAREDSKEFIQQNAKEGFKLYPEYIKIVKDITNLD